MTHHEYCSFFHKEAGTHKYGHGGHDHIRRAGIYRDAPQHHPFHRYSLCSGTDHLCRCLPRPYRVPDIQKDRGCGLHDKRTGHHNILLAGERVAGTAQVHHGCGCGHCGAGCDPEGKQHFQRSAGRCRRPYLPEDKHKRAAYP